MSEKLLLIALFLYGLTVFMKMFTVFVDGKRKAAKYTGEARKMVKKDLRIKLLWTIIWPVETILWFFNDKE